MENDLKWKRRRFLKVGGVAALAGTWAGCGRGEEFRSLFNGVDFDGWKVPEGDGGHWKVVDGVIDYDARSEGGGGNDGRSLWSEKSYKDFVLRVDWRLKKEGGLRHRVPSILPSGEYETRADGSVVETEILDVDSGIYLRGTQKGQVNIWMWPVGSGEVWAYRKDEAMPAEVRAACTPSVRADRPRGEWNSFEITMVGERLGVVLNGVEVISEARLPGIPEEGPIALQHHGTIEGKTGKWREFYAPGRWSGAPSLIQFREIWVKEI